MEQPGRTLFGESGVTLLVFVTLGLIFLAALRLPRFPKFGLLALPCALLLAAARWAPGLSDRGFWSLLLLELFGMLLAAALYFSESYSCQGVLLAAGLGETAILVFTAISGPRVLLPMSPLPVPDGGPAGRPHALRPPPGVAVGPADPVHGGLRSGLPPHGPGL